ncbi:MAG TPA: hypothetical protein VF190_05565 [Rhodothermales bacterium]
MNAPRPWTSASSLTSIVLLTAALGAGGCRQGATRMPMPEIESRADSVAIAVLDAFGGREAWESLRYLRFTFALEPPGSRTEVAWHLWDRKTDRYRVEWLEGDSTVVAIFDIGSRDGEVFVGGVAADEESTDELLATAYRRFINDTYWLMAPVKMLDPGVNREYVADSSDAEFDVVRLTFGEVGLTPGDTYWIYVDRETNTVDRWSMVLEGNPNAPPATWYWREYRDFEVPGGVVRFATKKLVPDSSFAIATDEIETPSNVPDSLFSAPHPVL